MKVINGAFESDRVLAAMDADARLHPSLKLSNSRKRLNGEMDDYWRSDDIAVVTPQNATRLPARLRLSVSRKDRSPYDAENNVEHQEYERKYLSRSSSRKDKSEHEEPQDDAQRYLSRSSSRKDRSEHEEPQDDARRYLSRSSSRKDRSSYEQEHEYYEDGSRNHLSRSSSRKYRPVFNHEEDGTRRQRSQSSSRKAKPVYEPEEEYLADLLEYDVDVLENGMEDSQLSDRRRAMFEPLGPSYQGPRDSSPGSILPPPDFDFASYPRGWVVGKKRKLVNVDVVESMRRIAVHEMNRKDREIGGLNEQLEEDSRTMGHLQVQLQQERTKRMQAERENDMLQSQINMLMTMLNEAEDVNDDA